MTVKLTFVVAVIFCTLLSVQAGAIEVKPGGELFLDYKYAFPSNSQEEMSLFEATRGYLTLVSEFTDRIKGRITYEIHQTKDTEIEVWDGTGLATVTTYSEGNT